MGIAVAAIYIPIYGLLSLIALIVGIKFGCKAEDSNSRLAYLFYYLSGFLISTIITLVLILMVPVEGNMDWNSLFAKISMTLLVPFSLGMILIIVSNASFKKGGRFSFLSSGALHSIIAVPWIALFFAMNYNNIVNYPLFSGLCKNAQLKIIKNIKPAKSVFLEADRFTTVYRGRQSELNSISHGLLNHSSLDFVEYPVNPKDDMNYQSGYERLTTIGKRVIRYDPATKLKTEYHQKLIDEPAAEYIVTSTMLDIPEGKERGIGGSRIEVKKRSDSSIIAFAQYYWDNKTFKVCPKEAHAAFPSFFILDALNAANPEIAKSNDYSAGRNVLKNNNYGLFLLYSYVFSPSLFYFFLLLIPIWKIFKRAGLPPALSCIMLIPAIGFAISALILSYADWKTDKS